MVINSPCTFYARVLYFMHMKINNTEENNAALKVLELLMENDPKPETNEGIALKTVADAVEEYEKKFGPDAVNE